MGQWLCNLYKSWGLELPQARVGVSISLIFLSALLTTLGLYDNLAKHAGAGMLVPITGFANSMVSPALEFKSEGFVTWPGGQAVHRGGALCWCMASQPRWCMGWCSSAWGFCEVRHETLEEKYVGI